MSLADQLLESARTLTPQARAYKYRSLPDRVRDPILPTAIRETNYLRIKNSMWLASSWAQRKVPAEHKFKLPTINALLAQYLFCVLQYGRKDYFDSYFLRKLKEILGES